METIFFLIDAGAVLLVLYYSIKNDRLREGEPELGYFRQRAGTEATKQPVAPARRARVL